MSSNRGACAGASWGAQRSNVSEIQYSGKRKQWQQWSQTVSSARPKRACHFAELPSLSPYAPPLCPRGGGHGPESRWLLRPRGVRLLAMCSGPHRVVASRGSRIPRRRDNSACPSVRSRSPVFPPPLMSPAPGEMRHLLAWGRLHHLNAIHRTARSRTPSPAARLPRRPALRLCRLAAATPAAAKATEPPPPCPPPRHCPGACATTVGAPTMHRGQTRAIRLVRPGCVPHCRCRQCFRKGARWPH